MDDLISRKALVDAFKATNDPGKDCLPISIIAETIEEAPAVDAEPVRHGRWIPRGDDDSDAGMYKCSECGDERYFGEEVLTSEEAATYARYCPNCGAKMDGGKKP